MKFLIPLESNQGLNSKISQHFGKALYYAIVTLKDGDYSVEIVENPKFRGLRPGEYFSQLDIDCVVVKSIGFKAVEVFRSRGIKIYSTDCEYLSCVIEKILRGELSEYVESPCMGENSVNSL